MPKINKKIIALSDSEHILRRPEMYVGSVTPTEERIPIIEDNKLVIKTKTFSVGMYKILDEVIDNSLDEAKRCFSSGKHMKQIIIKLNSETNEASVQDSGSGFKDPDKKNTKTGLSNVETAMTVLRAGSNFNNDDSDVNLIGMHGIGVSCTNVLSDNFGIVTTNSDKTYAQKWNKFKNLGKKIKKPTNNKTGTYIKFTPRKDIFKDTWDKEIIKTKVSYLKLLQKYDESLKDVIINVFFNGKLISDDLNFLPKDYIEIKNTKNLKVFSWPSFTNSVSVTFVNGSKCTGIHQRIIQDYINEELFDYERAHYMYDVCIIVDLPPKNVRFSDQNKTKFVSTRTELEPILKFKLTERQKKIIKKSEWYASVSEKIDVTLRKTEIKKLKKAKKKRDKKVSEKYFPSQIKDKLFIVEGGSAAGSILQKRDPKNDAVYTLRGKIKNVRTIENLSDNKEILDLMNILNLNIDDKGANILFNKIIISTDADADGYHIASLIINFFNKWFPNVIKMGKLFILRTPLISIGDRKRKYFINKEEFNKSRAKKTNIRYLKGLGSNDLKDWEYIFKNMQLDKITYDKYSDKMLNIAFGNNSNLRKQWLER